MGYNRIYMWVVYFSFCLDIRGSPGFRHWNEISRDVISC